MRTLAIFDFDGTLIAGDSLWLFLRALHGRPRALLALLTSILIAPFTTTFWYDPRTAIKEKWLEKLLAGQQKEPVARIANTLHAELKWLAPQLEALKTHAANGADIVVATGALDTYIHVLLEGLPVKDVLCTAVECDEAGMLTGRMLGNAVRGTKAVRLEKYIKANGPYDHIVGYGNLPNDRQMLALCGEAHII